MIRAPLLLLLVTSAAPSACTSLPRGGISFFTDRCPIPATVKPYTVAATAPAHPVLDSAFLGAVLRAVLWHWRVDDPSAQLAPQDTGEVASLLTRHEPIPFEFERRRPRARDRASVGLTLRAGGGVEARVLRGSGRAEFDSSLLAAIRRATLARDTRRVAPDTLPADFPPGFTADSAWVVLEFGADPATSAPAVRYARESKGVRALPGNPVPDYPVGLAAAREGGKVVLHFAVQPSGQVDMASVKVREASHPDFTREVLQVLPHYRFLPATLDCVPRRYWVELPFHFGSPAAADRGERARP